MATSPTPGAELPTSRLLLWVAGGIAVVGLGPMVLALARVFTAETLKDQGLAIVLTAVFALLFVVAPVVLVRFATSYRVRLGADRLAWLRRGEVDREIAFDDLTGVWVTLPSRGPLGQSMRALTLDGRDPSGAEVQIHVPGSLVTTLRPLLDRVAVEVAARPDLLTETERAPFAELLATER